MANLTQASRQLFERPADECFETLDDLFAHCQRQKDASRRIKEVGREFRPMQYNDRVGLKINGHDLLSLNDWSFTQLCSMAGVAKETVNRLSPTTAVHVLSETLRQRTDDETELQALVHDNTTIRAVNGERYKRLWNADLLAVVKQFALDFTPPQKGYNGATGLYAGQQDLFAFLIDPNGWIEIEGEAFAPGFFVFNSEVGRRSVGISTFWFQQVCANHVVWDAVDVVEVCRTHTAKPASTLAEIADAVFRLVQKRDERKDGFAKVITKAMHEKYGNSVADVTELLGKQGFSRALATQAAQIAQQRGMFSIWSLVDALTQLSRESRFAGTRLEADQKAASLLSLVA